MTSTIISMYRSFRPPGLVSPDAFFKVQLGILKNALMSNSYIMGDFNLDANMDHRLDYHYRIPLNLFTNLTIDSNLT